LGLTEQGTRAEIFSGQTVYVIKSYFEQVKMNKQKNNSQVMICSAKLGWFWKFVAGEFKIESVHFN